MLRIIKGTLAGEIVEFSDGTLPELGITSFEQLMADPRPIVPDLIFRLNRDYDDFAERDRIAHDIENLYYVHVNGLGHIYHVSEIGAYDDCC